MIDYKFTLRRFFVLVFLFVICPLVGWITYAHRTNAPANVFAESADSVSSNNITIPDDKLDMSTPYYQNEASEKLEKEMGRPTATNAENHYFGHEVEGNTQGDKKSEKTKPERK